MSFKDLIKDVSNFAQDSLDSFQEEVALKKEEQQRLREEMNRRITHYKEDLMQKLLQAPKDKALINAGSAIISFTESFYHDLYLPASNASHFQLTFYSGRDNPVKDMTKIFSDFTAQELLLMAYKDSQEQRILLTTDHLYFKVLFPDNKAFYCLGHLNLADLSSLELAEDDQEIFFLINDVPLLRVPKETLSASDLLSLKNYFQRLNNQNFDIKLAEIHQFILAKLNSQTIEILKEHLAPNETLVYFAWGLDSRNSNKFVACTTKKIFFYDREISLIQGFYYHDITAISAQASSINLLDLSLSIGTNPHELKIKTADQSKTISILYEKEAQKVIAIYRRFANDVYPAESQPLKPQDDGLALLEKLADLKEAGILTQAEFDAKKEDILSRL